MRHFSFSDSIIQVLKFHTISRRLRKLCSSQPKPHVFNEIKSMAELEWETYQESPLKKCRTIAQGLQYRLPKNALYHVPLISEDQIKRLLNGIKPDRCLMTRLQRKFKSDADANPEQWQSERDSKCLYRADKFSEDMLKICSTPDPEIEKLFDWPKPNPYVPKDLTIKSGSPNLPEFPVVSASN